MHIESIRLRGYRNFKDAQINLRENTLVIGANDVGKTNLLYALRILLDRSLPDAALDPDETDFYVCSETGEQADECTILIKFANINKDAVLATFKGAVSDNAETFIQYTAVRNTLERRLHIGPSRNLLEEIPGRHYLKYLSLRYVSSQRDLASFVQSEKKHLLRLSKEARSEEDIGDDETLQDEIANGLDEINGQVRELTYVRTAMTAVNTELRDLAHHHGDYKVRLETGSIQISQFIDKLELAGTTGGSRVGLGGDGRNNQILIALWKAKSEREQDLDNEAIIYCIEEPEAHLHPHQQRKLAAYLADKLRGQVIVTTHSPQITSGFKPDSIVRLVRKAGSSVAASNGCSSCIEEAWLHMGYRMSILPAEAFFADMVLLVEGPSEVLFYHELARQLEIDLDHYNISILAVDGVDFAAYVRILDAMELPWSARTDNDISKVPRRRRPRWRFAGLNRALRLANQAEYDDLEEECSPEDVDTEWGETSNLTNPQGVFVSKVDLECDLVDALPDECMEFAGSDSAEEAVAFLQSRKAIRMGAFLGDYGDALKALDGDDLAKPLHYCVDKVKGE